MGFFKEMRMVKDASKELPKLFKVLISCDKSVHYDMAEMYCVAFLNKHRPLFESRSGKIFLELFEHLDSFIMHSREHAVRGTHRTLDGTEKTTWPDLNDYLRPVFGIEAGLPKTWTLKWSRTYGN